MLSKAMNAEVERMLMEEKGGKNKRREREMEGDWLH